MIDCRCESMTKTTFYGIGIAISGKYLCTTSFLTANSPCMYVLDNDAENGEGGETRMSSEEAENEALHCFNNRHRHHDKHR